MPRRRRPAVRCRLRPGEGSVPGALAAGPAALRVHRRAAAARRAVGAVVLVAVAGLAVGRAPVARAADAPAAGEPAWAREVRDALPLQDAELTRSGPKRAVTTAENKANRDPTVVNLYLLARAFGKAGDTANALQTYGEVLKAEPRMWFALRDRGVLRALGKDLAAAEADLRAAVTLQPRYVDALQPLGDLLVDAKRYEEGIRVLQRVLDVDPARDSARGQIVQAYAAWGKPAEALAALDVLLGRVPRNLGLRLVRAQLLEDAGDPAAAQDLLKRLATEYPDKPDPLRAWLGIAVRRKQLDVDEGVWVLERLRRLAKDAKERAEIDGQITELNRRAAAASGAPAPGAAPTPEQVARVLENADPKAREQALRYVLKGTKGDFVLAGPLLVAVVRHMVPKYEPLATHRLLALQVLERFASPEMAPIVRIALDPAEEPDGRVRARAADVLAELGNPLGLAALAPHVLGTDEELSFAARHAAYRLASTVATSADETPEAFAKAFRTWWGGVEARDAKLRAVEAVAKASEAKPYELLMNLARDDDPAVVGAAYAGLVRLAEQARAARPAEASRVTAWVAALPALDVAALLPARRADVVASLERWWGSRPR